MKYRMILKVDQLKEEGFHCCIVDLYHWLCGNWFRKGNILIHRIEDKGVVMDPSIEDG